jgi:hypothetical protein
MVTTMSPRRRTAPTAPSLRIRDFLALVDDGVRERLGRGYAALSMRQRFGYVQYAEGDPSIHYEVWAQRKTARVEIGLHFEGTDRERNYAIAAMLAGRAADVVAAVGPEYELEEWTAQWTRLHQTVAAPSLTPELAGEVAGRLVALMQGMRPLLREVLAGATPAPAASAGRRRRTR